MVPNYQEGSNKFGLGYINPDNNITWHGRHGQRAEWSCFSTYVLQGSDSHQEHHHRLPDM